jgi:hypothetical protein
MNPASNSAAESLPSNTADWRGGDAVSAAAPSTEFISFAIGKEQCDWRGAQ